MSTTLGPIGFSSGNPTYLGGEEITNRPCAEAIQRVIDQEVAKLLRAALRADYRSALRTPPRRHEHRERRLVSSPPIRRPTGGRMYPCGG